MKVNIQSDRVISLHDLLVYATNLDRDEPDIDSSYGIDPEHMKTANKILTDFYFDGDPIAAQKTIDYYIYLNTEAGKYADVPLN